jgi:hypothetical protein
MCLPERGAVVVDTAAEAVEAVEVRVDTAVEEVAVAVQVQVQVQVDMAPAVAGLGLMAAAAEPVTMAAVAERLRTSRSPAAEPVLGVRSAVAEPVLE